jgi:integrase
MRDIVPNRNAPRTVASYETICRQHILPELRNVQLTKLAASHVDRLTANVRAKGRTANTAQHVFTVLRKALNDARKKGMVKQNACELAEVPHVEKYSVKMPGMAAISKLLEVTDQTDLGPAFRVAYHTGLRRGEILALRWQNVDLDNGVLAVVESVQAIKGRGVVVQPTKSAHGKRGVALSPETVALFRQHRVRQSEHILRLGGAYRDRDIVFAGATGDYLHPDTMTKAARLASRKAGIVGLRLHDLRHGHAEGLIRAGVHAKVVQERLGHASANFTMDVYGHVAAGLQAQAADAFSKLVATPAR